MYIPAEGVQFQLVSTTTNHRLFSRIDQYHATVGQADGEVLDSHYFTLIHGTSSNGHAGLYAIKGRQTSRVLFSRAAHPTIGDIDGDGKHDDNWFTFEEGSNKHANEFRILCPANSLVIFNRKSPEPTLANVHKDPINDNHYFKFTFEDMVVESVDFDVNLAKIVTLTPEVIAEQILNNRTGDIQHMSFKVSYRVTHKSLFEVGGGFTIGAKTAFKCGLPCLFEEKIEVNVALSIDCKYGTSEEYSKDYEASFPVNAGPHSSVHAKATVNKSSLTVPYTITLYSKRDPSVKVQTKGDWKGLTSWNLSYHISNAI